MLAKVSWEGVLQPQGGRSWRGGDQSLWGQAVQRSQTLRSCCVGGTTGRFRGGLARRRRQVTQRAWDSGLGQPAVLVSRDSPGVSTEILNARKALSAGHTGMVGHCHPGLTGCPALLWSTDIVNKDAKSTLRVLYGLFCKHAQKAHRDSTPRGAPN